MPIYKMKSGQLKDYGDPGTAATLVYDNTASGLAATRVQGAIDELQDEIRNKPTIPYSTWQTYSDAEKEAFTGYVSGYPDSTLNAAAVSYGNTTVDSALTTLNSKLTGSDVTISLATNNTSAYKINKLVAGTTQISGVSTTAGSWNNVARISHKPTTNICVPVFSTDTGNYIGLAMIKSSNGDIDVYSNTSLSNIFITFTFGYATND